MSSFPDPNNNNAPENDLIRGLVPVSFQLDESARRRLPGPYALAADRYDDYVWLEYRRRDGLAPAAVLAAVVDTLTSVLQNMHNLEVPQEMALRSLGFRVVIARGLQEAPREVDLLTQFASSGRQQQSQQNNARLGGLGPLGDTAEGSG
ncbi:uncharacterized protein PG986_010130 [Apiospora aurea]|uniref:Uncharacterized protein n=1 Tax=Apiospora aurea TaxID=335848 RepID=A0ABR1QA24_9PEZI